MYWLFNLYFFVFVKINCNPTGVVFLRINYFHENLVVFSNNVLKTFASFRCFKNVLMMYVDDVIKPFWQSITLPYNYRYATATAEL